MNNQRRTIAVIIGVVLALGWFVFSGPDRWNPGRVMLGIGMSIAAVYNLIHNPQAMPRFVTIIVIVPLLAAMVFFEVRNPRAGWPLALAWSASLLGLLFAHAWIKPAPVQKTHLNDHDP